MDETFLFELIKDYGYFAMFLFNWILLFGVPLPNEVAAATSGVITETGAFSPVLAFLSAYLGLISSNTFAYAIGYVFGSRLLKRLERSFLKNRVQSFNRAFEKHGNWAISFSFFLPGIRWAMPYVVGAERFPFRRYIAYAYSAGFVWMMIYFQLGRLFPAAYEVILDHLYTAFSALSVLILAAAVIFFYRRRHQAD